MTRITNNPSGSFLVAWWAQSIRRVANNRNEKAIKGRRKKKKKKEEERRRKKKKKATVYTIRIFFDGGTKYGANVHRHWNESRDSAWHATGDPGRLVINRRGDPQVVLKNHTATAMIAFEKIGDEKRSASRVQCRLGFIHPTSGAN